MAKTLERRAPVAADEAEVTTVITVRLRLSQLRKLKLARRELDTSMNQVVGKALDEYFERHKIEER